VKNPHLKVSSSKHEDTEDVADGFDVVLKATGCSVYKGSDVSAFPSVADIKFSLNEQYLCIAPKDCKMYCYQLPKITVDPNASNFPWDEFNNALQTKTPYYVLNKHTSMVTHFDFSVDCKYIQSNDLGNELLFYDLENKKQEPSATKLADYNGVLDDEAPEGRLWASQTCIFGWPVQGIWPPNAYDSSEINSVDRHNSMKYLATGEDSGHIRVLRFPSVTPNSSSVVLTGHSSHVTNVRWSAQHLISAGGNDKCVFVWEMTEK
jgi:WD40 repeat protein